MKKLVFVVLALLGATAFAEEVARKPADPKAAAAEQKMMEAWQKAGTPGAEHAKLKAMAGSYDAVVKAWMDPAAPPMESKGTAELKMILGDRVLQQDFSGSMMGQPFTGLGLVGYNNVTKKFWSTWLDTTATGAYAGEGAADKTGNEITFASSYADPMSGKIKKGKDIWKLAADGGFTFEQWGTGPKGGKPFKTLEITYTKKK